MKLIVLPQIFFQYSIMNKEIQYFLLAIGPYFGQSEINFVQLLIIHCVAFNVLGRK